MAENSVVIKGRDIYLSDGINEETVQDIIINLKELEQEEPRDDINFYISSFGGSAHGFLAIYDVIKSLECNVNTIGLGKSMSAGCLLLMSGTGTRQAYENTRIMLHGLQCWYPRQSLVDNDIWHKEKIKVNDRVKEIVVKETGNDKIQVEKDMSRDLFMNAEESKEYGIIDKIK